MKGNHAEDSFEKARIEATKLYNRGIKVNNPKLFTGEKTLVAYETVKNNFINQFQVLATQDEIVSLINQLYVLTLKHQIAVLPKVEDPTAGKINRAKDPILLKVENKFLPQAVNSEDAKSTWETIKNAMVIHCKEIAPNENEKDKHQKELKDFEQKILNSGLSAEEQGKILDIITTDSKFASTNPVKEITAALPQQESENNDLKIKRADELAKKAEEDRLAQLRIEEVRIIAEQEAIKAEQQKKAVELAKKIAEDEREQLGIKEKLAAKEAVRKEAEARAAEEQARVVAEQEAAKLEQQKKAAELAEKAEEDRVEELRIEKKLAAKEAEDRIAEDKAEKLEQQKVLEEEIEEAIKETSVLSPVIEQSNNKEIILENGQPLPSISIAEWADIAREAIAREAIEDKAYCTEHLPYIEAYLSRDVARVSSIVEQGSALSNLKSETIIPISTIGVGKFEMFKKHLPSSFIEKFILFSNIFNECKNTSNHNDKEINYFTKKINEIKEGLVKEGLVNPNFKETSQYECRINDLKAWYFEINSFKIISSERSIRAQGVLKQLFNLLEGFKQAVKELSDTQNVVEVGKHEVVADSDKDLKDLQMKKTGLVGGRTEEEGKVVQSEMESAGLYVPKILLGKSNSEGHIVATKPLAIFRQEKQDKSSELKKAHSYEDFTAMLGNPQGDLDNGDMLLTGEGSHIIG